MSLVTFRNRGSWFVAGFETERLVDPTVVQRAIVELTERLERLPLRSKVVISFEGVEQASSQIAGLLLAAKAVVVDDRLGRLVLCRVGPNLAELLRLTRLDGHFERYPRLRDLLVEDVVAAASQVIAKRELVRAGAPERGASDTEWID